MVLNFPKKNKIRKNILTSTFSSEASTSDEDIYHVHEHVRIQDFLPTTDLDLEEPLSFTPKYSS